MRSIMEQHPDRRSAGDEDVETVRGRKEHHGFSDIYQPVRARKIMTAE